MELAEMSRFMLVGLLQVVASGTLLQLLLGTLRAHVPIAASGGTVQGLTNGYVALAGGALLLLFFMACIITRWRRSSTCLRCTRACRPRSGANSIRAAAREYHSRRHARRRWRSPSASSACRSRRARGAAQAEVKRGACGIEDARGSACPRLASAMLFFLACGARGRQMRIVAAAARDAADSRSSWTWTTWRGRGHRVRRRVASHARLLLGAISTAQLHAWLLRAIVKPMATLLETDRNGA